ncbi:hypothetical protein D3C78_1888070 [compost metagenome]
MKGFTEPSALTVPRAKLLIRMSDEPAASPARVSRSSYWPSWSFLILSWVSTFTPKLTRV